MSATSTSKENQNFQWGRFAGIVVQLALICAIMYLYGIEQKRGMDRILPLLLGGFLLNALLPRPHRMACFLAVSVASVFLIIGLKFGLILTALALMLVGACHLPAPFWVRVGAVSALSGGLALVISGVVKTGWGAVVVPILGAMFMFRIVIYLYDIRNEKDPVPWTARLAYFFMLPNVCFPLFPVVDYRAFLKSHYSADELTTYQTGAKWMLRGCIHLLLYRYIYQTFTDGPGDLANLSDVLVYMLSTYLLYLRISGLFHLIVGILCIFGFNLPETHHLYYLASSFSDYWRRINIYWKDFMMKIFYYPVYMRFKKLGPTTAMVLATLVVFFGTWVLHDYQFFWLQGSYHIKTVDLAFWGILGVLVIINSVYQARYPKKASLRKPAWSWRTAAIHATKVVAMFSTITILWALWSGNSVAEFFTVMGVAAGGSALEFALLFAGIACAILIGVLVQYAQHFQWFAKLEKNTPWFLRIEFRAIATAGAIALFGVPGVEKMLGDDMTQLAGTLKSGGLNKRDIHAMERGYYEGLLGGASVSARLQEAQYQAPPEGWTLYPNSGADTNVESLLGTVLKPNHESVIGFAKTTTNEWGMRDLPYVKEKPAKTWRAALLGSSYELGFALEAEHIYEGIAESALNEKLGTGSVEILNFAVPGYCLMEYVENSAGPIWAFQPDAVIVAARTNDDYRSFPAVVKAFQEGKTLPPGLAEIFAEAKVAPAMAENEIMQALARLGNVGPTFEERFFRWAYTEIAKNCRDNGAVPVMLCVARTVENEDGHNRDVQLALAKELGYLVLDINDAFDGVDLKTVQIGPWDQHPNELGAKLLAERMTEEILANLDGLGIKTPSTPAVAPAN